MDGWWKVVFQGVLDCRLVRSGVAVSGEAMCCSLMGRRLGLVMLQEGAELQAGAFRVCGQVWAVGRQCALDGL